MQNSASIKTPNGKSILFYHWKTDQPVKGVVQIAHGLGEHALRYDEFAKVLNQSGYEVYANDHISHGKTVSKGENLGFYNGKNFWDESVEGMYLLTKKIKENHPNEKLILFGHSMGSLFSRDFIVKYGKELDGTILSGTGSYQPLLGAIAIMIAKTQKLFRGREKTSNLMKALFFGDFNKHFKPNRTDYDWLTRDEKEVDKYINDSLVIKDFSLGLMFDLLMGVKKVNQPQNFQSVPKDLPVFFFAGDKDPVGEMGVGVKNVSEGFKKAGVKNVDLKLYKNARHEMLNETNKEEAFEDVLKWLNKTL